MTAAAEARRVRAYCLTAAMLIARCGWAQHRYGTDDTGFCIAGALLKVESVFDDVARDYLRRVLRPDSALGLAEWNDTPGRTAEEAIDLLIAAALGDFDDAWERAVKY